MSKTLQPITGPNSWSESRETQPVSHERAASAFPVEHLTGNRAVQEAEAIVEQAHQRIAERQHTQIEFDSHSERMTIETIQHASREINETRAQELQRLNQWSQN